MIADVYPTLCEVGNNCIIANNCLLPQQQMSLNKNDEIKNTVSNM